MSTDTLHLTTDTNSTPDPTSTAFVVDDRFCGAPGFAHGGWLAGRLASRLPPGTTVEVTFRAPAPVGRELVLDVDADHQVVRLLEPRDGSVLLLLEARPANASPLAPSPVSWAQAALAESGFRGWWDHDHAGCFACGGREAGEGLRIFPGPVVGRHGVVATRWTPEATQVTADGAVPCEHVWAALDCATRWAQPDAALDKLVVRLHRAARPGEDYVVVARADGYAGIHSRTGDLVATAHATRR
jgi:hypothetical protein